MSSSPTYTPEFATESEIRSSGAPGSPTWRQPKSDGRIDEQSKRERDEDSHMPSEVDDDDENDASTKRPRFASSSSASSSSSSSSGQPLSFLDALKQQQEGYASRHLTAQTEMALIREKRAELISQISAFLTGCSSVPLESHEFIEIELRLGSPEGPAGFLSGVSQADYERLLQRLHEHPDFDSEVEPEQMEYCIDWQEQGTLRLTLDPHTKQYTKALVKSKLSRKDIKAPLQWDYQYVLRIAEAKENMYEPPGQWIDGWRSIRQKRRTKFRHKHLRSWYIDLTEVLVTERTAFDDLPSSTRKETRYEAEFELDSELAKDSRRTTREFIADLAQQLWSMLVIVLHPHSYERFRAQPEPTPSPPTKVDSSPTPTHHAVQDRWEDLHLRQVSDEQQRAVLRRALWEHVPNRRSPDSNVQQFPGAMPVAFSRRFFPVVQSSEYWVSEKTDGIRYLMFIFDQRVFLIDRKVEFYEITATFPQLAAIWPEPTIIDGEMTRHLDTGRPHFMIFDLLCINGRRLDGKLLIERLELIREEIVLVFRERCPDPPIVLIAKNFFRQRDIRAIFKQITKTPKGREYRDPKRHHLTDGIILTPNDIYRSFGNTNLFKWKFPDLLSIDFVVTNPRNMDSNLISLSCAGNRGQLLFCRDACFSQRQTDELRRLIAKANERGLPPEHPERNVVAECVYCPASGEWQFHTIRNDKHVPNHISVVMDTMEAVAENVSELELQYRLTKGPDTDDWQRKYRAAIEQIQSR